MPRKKIVPVGEQENNMETFGLPIGEESEGAYEFPEGLPAVEDGAEVPPAEGEDPPREDAGSGEESGMFGGFSDTLTEPGGADEIGVSLPLRK